MKRSDGRWNHNIHYFPMILAALPTRRDRALDVGCGEGTLARELRRHFAHVSGLDRDERCIELARRHDPGLHIDYLIGDFETFPFELASFDFVVCVAALHHMDPAPALQRMRALLRPGGLLAVVGLARSRHPADLPLDIAATIANRAHRLTKDHWESPAPTVWPPPHSYREIRRLASATLPGARFRRHLLWRYSITWMKPPA